MNPQSRLALKLRLERRLTDDLVRFCRAYLEAWANARTFGGQVPRAMWQAAAGELLARHYVRVVRSIEDGAHIFEGTERLDDVTDALTAQGLSDRAAHHGRLMIDRIEADLSDADAALLARPAIGKKSFAADMSFKKGSGKPWSVVVIASMRQAWERLKVRIPVWSNANTQAIAEETAGQYPLEVVADGTAGTEQIVKQWVTMQDERVRHAHAAAHGQIVPVHVAFEVGGEQLRFPGDTGLGASLGNVINCRCVAHYGVVRDGAFVPFNLATHQGTARAVRRPGEPFGARAPRVPSTAFTFGYGKGPWRGNIVLSAGERATYTVRDGGITIRTGRQIVASAPVSRDQFGKWRLGMISIANGRQDRAAIEALMRQSVEASNRLGSPH